MPHYRGRHVRPKPHLFMRVLGSRFMFGSWLGMAAWAMLILYTEVILLQYAQGGFQ